MGGSTSSADVTNITDIDTTNIADSFNRTVNRVLNLSEVGNVNIGQNGGSIWLPLAVVGAVAAMILFKKG